VFSFGKKNNNGIIDCSFLLKCIHRNILYLYILEGGGGGGFYSNGRSSTEFGGAYGVGGEEEVDSFRVEQVVVQSALKVSEDLEEVGVRTDLVEMPAGVEDIPVEHQLKMCVIRVEDDVEPSTVGRIRLTKKDIKLMAMVTLL
jgi:hypothetical protein